jgi:glycosyltransferase involved in cell wall biosynthesis
MALRIVDFLSHSAELKGGAALTDLAFMRQLARRHGMDCHILTHAAYPGRRRRKGFTLHTARDLDEVQHVLKAVRPDVLFCSLDAIYDGVRLGRRYSLPTLAYLHSYEYCPPTPKERQDWKVGKPARQESEVRWALEQADLLLVNSEYMQRRLQDRYGLASQVLYPEFEPEQFLVKRRAPRFLTGLCGYPHKGSDLFEQLARAFPRQPFLLVGPRSPKVERALRELPNVTLRDHQSPRQFLSETRVLLMPSRWAEPFGRVAVEAMANGIPTLASATGGLREVVGCGPLSVRPHDRLEAWITALSRLLDDPDALRHNAATGRQCAQRFLAYRSTDTLAVLIRQAQAGARPVWDSPPLVGWRGNRETATAYAMLNRRWIEQLGGPELAVQLHQQGEHTLLDSLVHHDYLEPPDLFAPPSSGVFIAMRTWDFGPWPAAWVESLNRQVDQLWVYSDHVRRHAIESGLDGGRVKVVRPGVDLDTFQPTGPRRPVPSERTVKFLFLGGTVRRKGVDILLEAYARAFTADDDVCLILKDHTRDVFYQGIDLAAAIARLASRDKAPEVLHLRELLPAAELAALYRAADVAVFPYRGEGYALPIVEAMACGVPVIVPGYGPALEHCRRDTAWFVKARELRLPVRGSFAYNSLGMRAQLEEVAFCEIDPDDLAAVLRQAYRCAEVRQSKGRAAAERARARLGQEHALAAMRKFLQELSRPGRTPVRVAERRRQAARDEARLQLALQLFKQARPAP